MLEQMSSAAAYDDATHAVPDLALQFGLPQCRITRVYNCPKCEYFSRNPRVYLAHLRDVHDEKLKIYECPQCIYASKHQQKLVRHIKMVHEKGEIQETDKPSPQSIDNELVMDDEEDIEDMLEEVQDSQDGDVDAEIEMYTEAGEDIANIEHCPEEQPCSPSDLAATLERTELLKHEQNKSKQTSKFFSCEKCYYVTHIKARFTKHVKYHSMPMIKCTICDFRTPYKWNLDRHMKNHGGTGNFWCSMCNFTADIQQSLTVHEMNHHTPPVGFSSTGGKRRRYRVGGSDCPPASAREKAPTTDCDRASPDSNSEALNFHAESEMLAYIKEENEMIMEDSNASYENVLGNYEEANRVKRRPPPPLIPLNSSTPNSNKTSEPSEPPSKKIKENGPTTDQNTAKEAAPRKKNESFFDKLKMRLLTGVEENCENGSLVCKDCGLQSKCLSEYLAHEKNCTKSIKQVATTSLNSLSSTRCQNCRHRCKSSADLYIHMQTCKVSTSYKESESVENSTFEGHVEPIISNAPQEETEKRHPMENVVFVWNTIDQNNDMNKFELPLDVTIDESSQPESSNKSYDPNNADEMQENSLSPTQSVGKKVFKCPHCPFYANTASRFHVHIVGHLNKKPFECSLCNYRSNWRWDITKHIRLKSVRDPSHADAKVLMTDETGRRNYSKYNKFLTILKPEDKLIPPNGNRRQNHDIPLDLDDGDQNDSDCEASGINHNLSHQLDAEEPSLHENIPKKAKKTLWKCKRCNYKDPSKEALLQHVREHTRESNQLNDDSYLQNKAEQKDGGLDASLLAYRCGHCNQLSNWKHVIQRHCRLKHNGIIKVLSTERPKNETAQSPNSELNINTDACSKCPFRTSDKTELLNHIQQHTPSPQSIFKCYFCPFFVKTEAELLNHLPLHGIIDPEEYVAKAMGGKSPLPEQPVSLKRHKCSECPYETNSKSQYIYHEQFHKISADTPYKCQVCNYSVSKRHLLNQHMKVHGVSMPSKKDLYNEPEVFSSLSPDSNEAFLYSGDNIDINSVDIPYVWVAAKNEFHKMYKCRFCSYVVPQKSKMPVHEKVHVIYSEGDTLYKCLECKMTCDSSSILMEHSKLHGEIYGRIYGPVDTDMTDEDQIAKLRLVLEDEREARKNSENDNIIIGAIECDKVVEVHRQLFFCLKCPARFFLESEWKIHNRFHELKFPIQCKLCSYTVPQEIQLTAHNYMHSIDYNSKTKMLQMVHETHPDYKQPYMTSVKSTSGDTVYIVCNDLSAIENHCVKKSGDSLPRSASKHYSCDRCPAKFFKSSALSYHLTLHGGDGQHKCKACDYTVKNIGNLVKHELVHDQADPLPNGDYESNEEADYKNIPISGTDLFQRKTEAQKRVHSDKVITRPNDHFPPVLQADPQFGYLMHGNPEFIYPTYLKNGRQKEKRYKCHKCPSAFEKREQYKVHLSLHGSKQRYKCDLCDYSVKYYANYVQHMRKHQMNAEAQAERKKNPDFIDVIKTEEIKIEKEDTVKLAVKTFPRAMVRSDFSQFSIGDQQTLRLLQRRRSSTSCKAPTPTENTPDKERKLHLCPMCPYTNQRKDALENHINRHKRVCDVGGNHDCSFCDFSANQSHFLREHIKSHFNHHKNNVPELFLKHGDLVFTISKVEEDETLTEIDSFKIMAKDVIENLVCTEDKKTVVQMSTGEIVVDE